MALFPDPDFRRRKITSSDSSSKESPNNDSPNNDSPNKDSPSNDSPSNDSPNNDSPNNDSPNKDWKRILPGLIVSAISLAVVFYIADIRLLMEALRLADYRLVALAGLLAVVWLGVRAIVWRTLLQEKATYKQVFSTVNEGYLLNNILPFRLGEVARAFLLSGKAALSFWEVFSTILIERALDVAMAAGLLLSTLSFVVGASWAWQAAVGTITLVLAGLAALYLLARNQEWALTQFEKLTSRWAVLNRIGRTQLPRFISGLSVLTDTSRFLRTIAWMIVNWGIALVQYYLLLLAFFPNGEFLWAAFSLAVTALGIAAPSSPGAVGVFELATVAALSVFGLSTSVALAYALTAHLLNYLITGVLGAYALARDGETISGLYYRLRRIPGDEAA
jgi:uncharacterized protein (TIRG00374 family)